jgi:hypothetical protein
VQGFKHVYQFALGEPITHRRLSVEAVELPPYTHVTFTDKDDVHALVLKWLEA